MTPYCLRRFTPEYRFDLTRRWRFDFALLAFDNLGQCGIMAGARDERSAFYFGAIGSNNSISCEQSAPYHVDQLHSALATDDAPHGMERFVMPDKAHAPNCVCISCGKEFYTKPYYIRRDGGKFCSRACRGSWHTGEKSPTWKGGKVEVECQSCHRKIMVKPSHLAIGEGKYCSKSCRREAKNVKITCAGCGEVFLVPNSEIKKHGRLFCSMECKMSYHAARTNCTCVQCGIKFFVKECDLCRKDKGGVGRFCSMDCKAEWMSSHARGHNRGHGGRRSDLGGIYVRSSWEANYARYLNWLVSVGEIERWEFEAETFEFPIKRGSKFYTPDFKVYCKNGAIEYHEVKGYMDDKSAVKLKRFSRYFPALKLVLIDAECYRAIARQMKNALPGWEKE